ncbi:plasmid-related protein [Alcaligenes sp. CHO6]|uniref:plasmid-related protein n=1 Tax=Alcaligenes sp. CHO6 TaxID=3123298 RepID=UPI003014F097
MYTGCHAETHVKESGLRIRVETQLREEFLHACRKEDLTAAQVLRAFMRSYVEKQRQREQVDLFDAPARVTKIG